MESDPRFRIVECDDRYRIQRVADGLWYARLTPDYVPPPPAEPGGPPPRHGSGESWLLRIVTFKTPAEATRSLVDAEHPAAQFAAG